MPSPPGGTLQRWRLQLSGNDFAIHARVRRLLTRRWIRTDCLEIGTTQGVVLLKGRLEAIPGAPRQGDGSWQREVQELAVAIRALPEVVDVAMQLREPERMNSPCRGTEG